MYKQTLNDHHREKMQTNVKKIVNKNQSAAPLILGLNQEHGLNSLQSKT
jgi:hypothetical protein